MKESIYKPRKLEALRADINTKLEKKKLSFFQKIINFFLGK